MRAIAWAAALLLASALAPAPAQPAKTPPGDVPDSPDPAARYLIYLHGRIVELQGRTAVSPDFGRYEYDGILTELGTRGFSVIAELRSPDAGEPFAEKVAGQIGKLLRGGVPPARITVVGFSRGGLLTVAAAARAAHDGVGYVVLAGCSQEPDWVARWAPVVRGRMLSLYDRSDRMHPSCAPLFARAPRLTGAKEIVLRTGLDHGLFYAPRPEWLDPVTAWAMGKRMGI